MGLGKNGKSGDRRRLSGDEFLHRDHRIWAMRVEGYSIQEIADACSCGLATVDRALKRLVARQAELVDDDLDADVDAVLARYADGGLKAEDVTCPEDVVRLNDLERFRWEHRPKPPEWWEGRNALGQLLSEEAEIREKIAAGWRYRDFAWHPPA